jgi:Pentapeptide repeats (8 copies)
MLWSSVSDPVSPFESLPDRMHTMTETDHLSLLRQGTDAWNAWREANSSIWPDLRDANLSGVNLAGAFLRGAALEKRRMTESRI